MMKVGIFLFPMLAWSVQMIAQNDPNPLITDRPGEGTDAPFVLAPSEVQIETGILYQEGIADEHQLIRYPTMLLRVGLIERIELRASADLFEESRTSTTYISPLILGAKVHLTENQGWIPQSALLVHFTIPDVGSEEVQAEYAQPQIKLLMGHTLTETLGLTTNLGISWEEGLPFPVHSYAESLDIGVSDFLSAFVELYGFWSQNSSIHLFNAGGTILLLPDLQIDLAGGLGISEKAPDFYLGGGVSVRF